MLDPIYMMGARLKEPPLNICKNGESEHICYKSSHYDNYNKLYRKPYGVICLMKNFTVDPFKSTQTNYIYKGPIDHTTKGSPLLSKGFFSMNCKLKNKFRQYPKMYHIKRFFIVLNGFLIILKIILTLGIILKEKRMMTNLKN